MSDRRGPSGRDERGGPGSRRGLPARRPRPPRATPPPASAPDAPGDPERPGAAELRGIIERATASSPPVVVRGTLRRAEVEAQPLVLDADDGTTWELLFPAGWSVDAEPGARVSVAGDPAPDVMTTTMVGPVLRVRSLSRGD